MDISIEGYERKFTSELFYKRDFFPFQINFMLYFDSKKPYKIFYASIASEILLIASTTTDLTNMLKRVNLLLIQKKKQGSECTRIIFIEKDVYKLQCICVAVF